MVERVADVLLDLRHRPRVDQRADRHAGAVAGPDDHPPDLLREQLHDLVVDAPLDEDAVRADARLARVPELRGDQPVDGALELGVVEDHVRRVTAELEREPRDLGSADIRISSLPTSVEPVNEIFRTRASPKSVSATMPEERDVIRFTTPGRRAGVLDRPHARVLP